MNTNAVSIHSILLVDDSLESLELYSSLLKKMTDAKVICAQYPSEAIKLANRYFFDIILIDVTINFNDTQMGGIEIYKSLKPRYGDSSLIIYSQYISDSFLRQYEFNFNFIEKGLEPKKFIEGCLKYICELRKRQTCFVAMPFDSKYNLVFETIVASLNESFYKCIRIDQQHFTKSIVEKIFLEIGNAKLVVFLATDRNPNAFYECGYSVALNKEIITLTDYFESLPFDIRDRNAIAYKDNVEGLVEVLSEKLKKITNVD